MSQIPIGGLLGSAAGAPLAQTRGSETERSQTESSRQTAQAEQDRKAERAAGVGATEEDQATGDRDGDGRRMWEHAAGADTSDGELPTETDAPRRAKKDDCGNQLDLMG